MYKNVKASPFRILADVRGFSWIIDNSYSPELSTVYSVDWKDISSLKVFFF